MKSEWQDFNRLHTSDISYSFAIGLVFLSGHHFVRLWNTSPWWNTSEQIVWGRLAQVRLYSRVQICPRPQNYQLFIRTHNPIVLDIERCTSENPEKKQVLDRFSEMNEQHVFNATLGIRFNLTTTTKPTKSCVPWLIFYSAFKGYSFTPAPQ